MILNPIEHDTKQAEINVICYIISWISVFANPIIYICTSSMYKEAFFNLFRCNSFKGQRSNLNSHLIDMNTMGRDVRTLPREAF